MQVPETVGRLSGEGGTFSPPFASQASLDRSATETNQLTHDPDSPFHNCPPPDKHPTPY